MSEQGLLPGFDELREPALDEGIGPDEAARISEAARSAFEGGDEQRTWMGDYQLLRAEGWPWRVACYIAWASVPREIREPKTLGELASVLGLASARSIHVWRSKNPEIDERVRALVIEPLMEARADVIQALIKSATDPDHKSHPDRKLALEMAKLHTPKTEIDMEIKRAGVFLPEVDDLDEDAADCDPPRAGEDG